MFIRVKRACEKKVYLPVIYNQAEVGKVDDFRQQTAYYGTESYPVLAKHVVMKFP
jgi:hypothetical protein